MRRPGGRRGAALLAALGWLLLSAPARASTGVLPDPSTGLPAELDPFFCEEELVIFESLRYGAFDFCRLHLRYVPGAADCLRIVLPTCNVLGPGEPPRVFRGTADWILHGHGERIVCPPGPPPPSCPAGFPAGPIPRP